MFIANVKKNNPIKNMFINKTYTCFIPKISNLDARKKWIISSLSSSGKIHVDEGAARALIKGKSLLAAGIKKVNGTFSKGDHVKILDKNLKEYARGLSSFSSEETIKIQGQHSNKITELLGSISKSEVIHKYDMVVV